MSPPHASKDRIVAVGLLTRRDVEVLGIGFRRLYPVEDCDGFDDLLRQLDRLPRQVASRD